VALILPIAFNKLTFTAFQGIIPLHGLNALGLSMRGVTGIFAMTGVLFAVFQAVGGVLADRFPPRGVVLAFTPPLLASLWALSGTQGGLSFAAVYAGYVCCSSTLFTATLKHVSRAYGTKETYGGVFGVLATLTDLMTVVGPVVFLGLYGTSGSGVFATMGAIGLGAAVAYAIFSRRSKLTSR
jgi:hypothetical protein